jgi:hypothetical protein
MGPTRKAGENRASHTTSTSVHIQRRKYVGENCLLCCFFLYFLGVQNLFLDSLMPMLAAYRNLFCFFLDFVVCRFCTSKRCFGYFRLGLAMRVLVEVLVRDSEKNKFWLTSFGRPQECQNKTCFGKSKSIYQNLFFHRVFAMSLVLSI